MRKEARGLIKRLGTEYPEHESRYYALRGIPFNLPPVLVRSSVGSHITLVVPGKIENAAPAKTCEAQEQQQQEQLPFPKIDDNQGETRPECEKESMTCGKLDHPIAARCQVPGQ
jgi:hypothetical protein